MVPRVPAFRKEVIQVEFTIRKSSDNGKVSGRQVEKLKNKKEWDRGNKRGDETRGIVGRMVERHPVLTTKLRKVVFLYG